jgi:S-formylglutathione hydrolase FrmB
LVLFFFWCPPADALGHRRAGGCLAGRIVDHTNNGGRDCRFWSAVLHEPRNMYVYLPPGFDPGRQYPILIWLHGLGQDERSFVEQVAPLLDAAIASGRLPPVIAAAPDGNVSGQRQCLVPTHSAFLNTRAGPYEDYLYFDVWGFLLTHYPIRPERQAHVLGGVSIGGGGAYHLAIKHRETFGVVCGIFPPLNFRWVDCHCRYFGKFDPSCWGWRTSVSNGHEAVGKFYGVIRIPVRKVVYPLYGRGPDVIARVSENNPIEMLDAYDVRPGELAMCVAFGGRDEFNLDAQIESFLYRARQRGLPVTAFYDPNGHHNARTAQEFAPDVIHWLALQLAPFSLP